MRDGIFIHNEIDNVGVVLGDGFDIPRSHKIALTDIAKGQDVIEYGETIGHAICHIKEGELVHTHNLVTNRW